ncbi:MAG: T9SS type A sorting domain-containing protein [Bacteroidetes bacterium]|nr:T9SS type A sorting domain-containing protein [Bacteroidota bacterium]
MRYFRLLLLGCLFVAVGQRVYSQGIGIGDWRDHLPYDKCISVAEAGEKMYCATPFSIFNYDKTDNSVSRLSKVNGLSDVGITSIAYSNDFKKLVVVYSNCNIDLVQGNNVINIPDINRKPILGKKTINKVVIDGRYAYLCCGFGIVVLDLMKEEIKDSYYIGPEGNPIDVLDMTNDGQHFWVATEDGVYKALVSDPNLSNYASWSKDTGIPLPNRKFNAIEHFRGNVYVNYSNTAYNKDSLFVYDGLAWDHYDKYNTTTRLNINAFENSIIFVNVDFVEVLDTNMLVLNKIWGYFLDGVSYYPQPKDAIVDKDGAIWIADGKLGLLRNTKTWIYMQVKPNGPNGEQVFAMASSGEKICAVPGGRNLTWGNLWTDGAMYSFENETWSTVDNTTQAIMDSLKDFTTLAIDPTDPARVYAGTWGYGLCEFYNNTLMKIWEGSNSILLPPVGYPDYQVFIGGLKVDPSNNLWVTNSGTSNVIAVRKASDGNWLSYNLSNLVTGASNIDVGDFTIDQLGQIWILLRGNKLLVFYDNNTLVNTADDQAKIITSGIGYGSIPGARVLSIATDLEGQVWLGTDEGVAVFYAPENVFSNQNFDAQRIYVTQDGYTQYLLETEAVTCIAIDGSNKKWFGTERAGVFLMSADGTQQLYHFTQENSPLLSNSVTSISINNITGEVFFGTTNGICSFKGKATQGNEKNADVYAYPNPVEPGYEGYIAVKGLVKDADVKITDISGNLIYHTRAEGGQAIWNGKNFDGRKASTGVYMVFISNDDGSETYVTKILFKK